MHDHTDAVDWAAISGHMARRQELELPQLREILRWLDVPTGAAVADVGCGAGGMVELLAERVGATGMVYAVDGNDAMRAATQAVVEACSVDAWVRVLPGDLEQQDLRSIVGRELDLVHASAVVHHLADEVDGLRRLATALAVGGRLVVVEGGLPTSHLPADCGVGRPGLEGRMREVQQQWFWSTVRPPDLQVAPGDPSGWNQKLLAAGLAEVETRTFLLDLPAPLSSRMREGVRDHYVEWRERFGHLLDGEDIEALEVLVDAEDPRGVLHRSDVFVLGARTAFVARRNRR